jgi:hypothetical protein
MALQLANKSGMKVVFKEQIMKHIIKCLITGTVLLSIGAANSQVVQKEISDLLIIAVRPIDMWSPDIKFNQLTLDIFKERQLSFSYSDNNGKIKQVFQTLFHNPDKTPISDTVISKIKSSGFQIGGSQSMITVQPPTSIATSDLPEFIAAQNAVYAKSIEKFTLVG